MDLPCRLFRNAHRLVRNPTVYSGFTWVVFMNHPVAVYWILKGPNGRLLCCELVRAAGGLEVRAANTDAPRREVVLTESDGLTIAAAWKALYQAKGWVSIEVSSGAPPPNLQVFRIDRSQRIHSDGLVVRVCQVFGTDMYGWDHNREQPPADRPLYHSRDGAEAAADRARQLAGHVCNQTCNTWRLLT
jgi:hypothetical protein